MKKIVSILLILALTAGFFGCGKKVKEEETLFSTEVSTSSETTKEPEEFTLPPLGNYDELPTVPGEWD